MTNIPGFRFGPDTQGMEFFFDRGHNFVPVALDLDGTLIPFADYGAPETWTTNVAINQQVIAGLMRRGCMEIAIVTNQGGIPRSRREGTRYPSPLVFVSRARSAILQLRDHGFRVFALLVSVYNPRADDLDIQWAAREIRKLVMAGSWDPPYWVPECWHVYTAPASRKPAPRMLNVLSAPRRLSYGVEEYWGDSPEDQLAAQNAGLRFVPVERYYGRRQPKTAAKPAGPTFRSVGRGVL